MKKTAIRSRVSCARSRVLLTAFIGLACAFSGAAHGQRPSNAEVLFRLANPCPSTGATHGTCPGYVIDRVIPVVCGGAEDPANMQWQTIADAREKDRWERIGCRRGRKLVLPGQSESVTEAFAIGENPQRVDPEALPPQPPARE